MGILGIIFNQQRTVIGAKNITGSNFIEGLASNAATTLVTGWSAKTTNGIVLDASVSEEHITSCDLTENPVEDGAKITDHVQIKPVQLTIEGVITDTPLGYAVIGNIQNVARNVATLFGKNSRSVEAYNELVKLQQSRQPFTVITGLKRYQNMIMTELSVPRDANTGAAIHFKATMKEIRIVKSKTTSFSSSISDLASPTKNLGQKITDAVPAVDPLSSNPSGTSTQQRGSELLNLWNNL